MKRARLLGEVAAYCAIKPEAIAATRAWLARQEARAPRCQNHPPDDSARPPSSLRPD